MSGRFDDGDFDEEPWRSRLWSIDRDRALATRPGLRALTELRDALLALPERRLLLGQACVVPFGEDDEPDLSRPTFCAMGALLYRKRVALGEISAAVVEDLAESRFSAEDWGGEVVLNIAEEAKRLGVSKTLATEIQWINDADGETETDEHRYERVLAWTLAAIKKNPHS